MTEAELLASTKPATVGLTMRLLADLSKALGEILTKHRDRDAELEAQLAKRDARLAALEERIAVLEARPSVKYLGIWTDGDEYRDGDFVTDRGSLWACCRDRTTARPGENDDWQLAAKRGRDGRNARAAR